MNNPEIKYLPISGKCYHCKAKQSLFGFLEGSEVDGLLYLCPDCGAVLMHEEGRALKPTIEDLLEGDADGLLIELGPFIARKVADAIEEAAEADQGFTDDADLSLALVLKEGKGKRSVEINISGLAWILDLITFDEDDEDDED